METILPSEGIRSPFARSRRATDLRRATVLVVDDDAEMRGLLADALRERKFDVEEAVDGLDAMAFMERRAWRPLDVIVLDYLMPRATGMDVLVWMRARAVRSRMVLVSAFADEALERAARQFGASAVLAKPFPLAEFLYLVSSLGSRRG